MNSSVPGTRDGGEFIKTSIKYGFCDSESGLFSPSDKNMIRFIDGTGAEDII